MLWRDIEGYDGYEVSESGLIYSKPRKGFDGRRIGGKFLKYGKTVHGYQFVVLRKYGVSRNELVHRLVAKAFIDNPENKLEINHIDGDKENNWTINLEWATRSENRQHAMDLGLHPGNGWKKKVKITNRITGDIFIVDSKRDANRYFGFKKSWIDNRLRKQGNPFTYNNFIVEVL
jgi:hypothetical protein